MNREQYEELRMRGRRQMPPGHPVGFEAVDTNDSWDGRTYTPEEDEDWNPVAQADTRPEVDFLGVEFDRTAYRSWYSDAVGPAWTWRLMPPSIEGAAAPEDGNSTATGGNSGDRATVELEAHVACCARRDCARIICRVRGNKSRRIWPVFWTARRPSVFVCLSGGILPTFALGR